MKFIPALLPIIEQVKIVSARTSYESPSCPSPLDWKVQAFEAEIVRACGAESLIDPSKRTRLCRDEVQLAAGLARTPGQREVGSVRARRSHAGLWRGRSVRLRSLLIVSRSLLLSAPFATLRAGLGFISCMWYDTKLEVLSNVLCLPKAELSIVRVPGDAQRSRPYPPRSCLVGFGAAIMRAYKASDWKGCMRTRASSVQSRRCLIEHRSSIQKAILQSFAHAGACTASAVLSDAKGSECTLVKRQGAPDHLGHQLDLF